MRTLGWGIAEEAKKRIPPARKFVVLGVVVDLSQSSDGVVIVRNKEDRVQELEATIEEMEAVQSFPAATAAKVYGRLNFAEAQCSGRWLAPLMGPVKQRALMNRSVKGVTSEIRKALRLSADLLRTAPPRRLEAVNNEMPHGPPTELLLTAIVRGFGRHTATISAAAEDLKLENICFCEQSPTSTHIKVIDWGLAGSFEQGRMKSSVGTSTYSAPEVLDPEDDDDGYTRSPILSSHDAHDQLRKEHGQDSYLRFDQFRQALVDSMAATATPETINECMNKNQIKVQPHVLDVISYALQVELQVPSPWTRVTSSTGLYFFQNHQRVSSWTWPAEEFVHFLKAMRAAEPEVGAPMTPPMAETWLFVDLHVEEEELSVPVTPAIIREGIVIADELAPITVKQETTIWIPPSPPAGDDEDDDVFCLTPVNMAATPITPPPVALAPASQWAVPPPEPPQPPKFPSHPLQPPRTEPCQPSKLPSHPSEPPRGSKRPVSPERPPSKVPVSDNIPRAFSQGSKEKLPLRRLQPPPEPEWGPPSKRIREDEEHGATSAAAKMPRLACTGPDTASSATVELLAESSETMDELRVAQLFGGLLGQVPDGALRQQFEQHLKGMSRKKAAPHPLSPRTPSSPSRRPKPHLQDELEDLRTRLGGGEEEAEDNAAYGCLGQDKEAIAKKVLKLLIHAFSNNASKALRRRAENLKPRSVAQALAAVIAFDVKLLKDHWEVLPELFKPVSLDAAAAGHLWQVMSGAHPVVRLAFLESVVVQEVQMEGPASAVAKWQRAGVELSAVVAACLDFVSREEEEMEFFRHVPVPRRPRTKKRWLRKRKQVWEWEWWGNSTAVRLAGWACLCVRVCARFTLIVLTGSSSALPTRKRLSAEDLLAAPTEKAKEDAASFADPAALNALGEQKEKEDLWGVAWNYKKTQSTSGGGG
eukprot:g33481.t1